MNAAITLLFCLTLCADDPKPEAEIQIPADFREYFKRADSIREKMVKSLESDISDFKVSIRGEANADKKSILRQKLRKTEDTLDDLKKGKMFAYIENNPDIGDIGVLKSGKIHAVIDDKTAILAIIFHSHHENSHSVVLTGVPTKSLKKDEYVSGTDVWRVTAKTTEDKTILRHLWTDRALKYKYYVVEPIKKADVEKYRKVWEEEKKVAAITEPNNSPKDK